MLDLSNTLVDDADISHLMSQCTNIRVLKLAGCRKLTSVSATLFRSTSGNLLHREAAAFQHAFRNVRPPTADVHRVHS